MNKYRLVKCDILNNDYVTPCFSCYFNYGKGRDTDCRKPNTITCIGKEKTYARYAYHYVVSQVELNINTKVL